MEQRFSGVAVFSPLAFAVLHALPFQLVLQFYGHHGDAVQRQHHINSVVVLCRVGELACTGQYVLMVFLYQFFVFVRRWLEVGKSKFNATVFHSLTQNVYQTEVGDILLEDGVKLLLGPLAVHILIPLPRLRLRLRYKTDKRSHIDGFCLVVGLLVAFDISTLAEQIGFYVAFKSFFRRVHIICLCWF